MAKQEPIPTEKLRYDVSLYNSEYETKTVYKGATLKFLIDSLKKLNIGKDNFNEFEKIE